MCVRACVRACARARVCVCVTWLLFDRPQYLRFCLFEMHVSVVFVIRYLYSAVSLTLGREHRFIRIIIVIIIIIIILNEGRG